MQLVTVLEPGFCTPRIVMHRCLAQHVYRVSHRGRRWVKRKCVRGLHDDSDAPRLDCLLHGDGDLLCEPLLHLQPPAERLGNASELGDAQHELVRDVRNCNLRMHAWVGGQRTVGACERVRARGRTLPVNGTR